MAVTRDSVTGPTDTTGTSQTFAHTCSGSNRALAVFVAMSDVVAISSVTYGGTAMTVVQNLTLGTGERIAFFVLNAPPSGTANVVITVASSCNIIGAAYSVNNADQADCVSVSAQSQGSNNSPLLDIDSTSTQELVLASVVTDGNVTMGPGAGGETEEWDITGASTVRHGGYSLPANGGTTAINPSLGSSITWGMVGLAFKAAAGGGGTTTTKTMTDTLSITDAALRRVNRVRQLSDATVITDGAVFWRRLPRILTDTLTLADSVVQSVILGGATTYTKIMTDTLSASDFAVQWLRRVRNQIETIFLSDGDTYRISLITASESVDMTDGFVSWRRLKRVVGDNLDLIDGFSKALAGAGIVYAKVMSDALVLVDDAGQRWKLRTSQLTDAVGLSDQVVRAVQRIRVLGDVIEYSDGTVKVQRLSRVAEDSLEISDAAIATRIFDQLSGTSFTFGASGPPFTFGGL